MLLFIFVGATLVFGVARLIRLAEKVFQTKRQLKKEKN
jgi:Sec-independent protein translocase protein TatA